MSITLIIQLKVQRISILDAVSGFAAPIAQDRLHQLTRLVKFLLSGVAHPHNGSLVVWSTNNSSA